MYNPYTSEVFPEAVIPSPSRSRLIPLTSLVPTPSKSTFTSIKLTSSVSACDALPAIFIAFPPACRLVTAMSYCGAVSTF